MKPETTLPPKYYHVSVLQSDMELFSYYSYKVLFFLVEQQQDRQISMYVLMQSDILMYIDVGVR